MEVMTKVSPVGRTAREAARQRARRSADYRAEQERVRPYEEIARQIIRLRMDHDLSQEQLAARVKTTKTAISRLESGRHAPTVATLRKIATAFNGHLLIGFDVPPAKGRRARSRRELARV
jgi:ribosome-binding protein aMBF1 (putative translation factor)